MSSILLGRTNSDESLCTFSSTQDESSRSSVNSMLREEPNHIVVEFDQKMRRARDSCHTAADQKAYKFKYLEERKREIDEMTASKIPFPILCCSTVTVLVDMVVLGVRVQWKPSDYPDMKFIYELLQAATLIIYLLLMALEFSCSRATKSAYLKRPITLLELAINIFETIQILAAAFGWLDHFPATKLLRLRRMLPAFRIFGIVLRRFERTKQWLILTVKNSGAVILSLLIVLYAGAVVFAELFDEDSGYDENVLKMELFSDLGHAMVTMWGFALGQEWDLVRPVYAHQPSLLPLLFVFFAVAACGILNAFIGTILSSLDEAEAHTRRKILDQVLVKYNLSERSSFQADSKNSIRKFTTCLLTHLKEQGIKIPNGLTTADFLDLLVYDRVSTDDLDEAEILMGLERLMESDPFHQACLAWIMQARTRRESAFAFGTLIKELGEVRRELGKERGELAEGRSELDKERNKLGEVRSKLREERSELGIERSELGEVRSELCEVRSELGEVRRELREVRSEVRSELREVKKLLEGQSDISSLLNLSPTVYPTKWDCKV